jgi:Helix-turn-helix domain
MTDERDGGPKSAGIKTMLDMISKYQAEHPEATSFEISGDSSNGAVQNNVGTFAYREMLEFTKETVDQIARTTGYEDPASFRRVFQRVMGMSPTDYRRRFGVARAALPASADV